MRVHPTAHIHDRPRRKLQQQSYEELVAAFRGGINEDDAGICREIPDGGEDLPCVSRAEGYLPFGNIIPFCVADRVG